MKHQTVIAGLLINLLCMLPVFAQQTNPELEEATAFFSQLATQSDNPVIAALAQDNLARLQKQRAVNTQVKRQVEVPLIREVNNSLAVPVLLNRKVMATFVVDTGATYTVITPSLAKKLGVEITPDTPRIAILTANGTVNAPVVTLPAVALGEVEVRGVKAIVKDLGSDVLLAGLLGMNFFQNMDLTIRQNKLVIEVSNVY